MAYTTEKQDPYMAGASYVAMDPELALRKTDVENTGDAHDLSQKEQDERDEVNEIMNARERYGKDRQNKEREWTESFKMYMSWLDTTLNPFLSNLFIPKTHEAVELLSAFLIGNNQSISATPENGSSSPQKSQVAARWLDWMWRKVLKARIKILIWIKQAIVFGNGVMKVGYDADEKRPWMEVRPIEDVYFDYWQQGIQDSEYIIDEIRRTKEDVMSDEKYDLLDSEGNPIRSGVIEGGTEGPGFQTEALFNTYDGSIKSAQCAGKVLVLEVWCKSENKLKTLLPTSLGWRIARDRDNPNFYNRPEGKQYFAPFVKLRFKPSPVPNRAYDMGGVYPTIKIQRAFNDLMNEYFDAVVLINAPMWVKRRGARINPAELVRRPGGVITVSDINKDLKTEVVGDVKQSIIEMLNRLDHEFEQASMVVNLLKGIQGSGTATESALAQQNIQTLLDMIDENLIDALSELGQMVLAISQENSEGLQSIKLFETDNEIGMLEFDPKDIDGQLDLVIRPDRDKHAPLAIQQKQLLDFTGIIKSDPMMIFKYPGIMEKIYKRWLENSGVADVDYFFQKEATGLPPGMFDKPKIRMDYKDLPEDVKREAEASAGYEPSKIGTTPQPDTTTPTLPAGITKLGPGAAPLSPVSPTGGAPVLK